MAARKTLKSRIDDLFSALGGPEADRPAPNEIRNELSVFASMAEALENGEATLETEAEIAALDTALEQSNATLEQSHAENTNLKATLQTINTEIEALREEKKKREEKERDIPDIQLKILRSLPSKYGGSTLNMREIARTASVRVDEAEIYVEGLEKLEFAVFEYCEPGGGGWRRTAEGNKLVVAKRWAGEEEKEEIKTKRSKHGELTHPEEIALLKMAENVNEGAIEPEIAKVLGYTQAQTAFILLLLSQKNMAAASDEPDYGSGVTWFILTKGLEHLGERGLL
jgi:hypothetical protein